MVKRAAFLAAGGTVISRGQSSIQQDLNDKIQTESRTARTGTEHEKSDDLIMKMAKESIITIYEEEMVRNIGNGDFMKPSVLNVYHKRACQVALEEIESNLAVKMTSKSKAKLATVLETAFTKHKDKNHMNAPIKPAIGIDLGATFACVAVYHAGKVTIIPNENSINTTPSYVAFKDGTEMVGEPAKHQALLNPENTIYDAKRIIGRKFNDPVVQEEIKQWPFTVVNEKGVPKILTNGETYHLEEISAKVLSKMKEIAENFLNCSVENAVITVPAYFNDGQRQATRDAGHLAGLNVLEILNEPTAAAIAYTLNYACLETRNVLVYDFGDVTFDVAILSIQNAKIVVKAVDGDIHLGGEDLDNNIVDYCIHEFKKSTNIDLKADRTSDDIGARSAANRSIIRLKNVWKMEKFNLRKHPVITVYVEAIHGSLDLAVNISRKIFNNVNKKLLDKSIVIVHRALDSAKMKKEDIDDIVLVGGSTGIPQVQELLKDLFNNTVFNTAINPVEVVAFGAAIQAAVLNGDNFEKLKSTSSSDIDSLSIGVQNSTMAATLPRIPTIPATEIKNTTFVCNQTAIKKGDIAKEHQQRLEREVNNLLQKMTDDNKTPKSKKSNSGQEESLLDATAYAICENFNTKCKDGFWAKFKEKLEINGFLSNSEFTTTSDMLIRECLQDFDTKKTIGDSEIAKKYRKRLEGELGKLSEKMKEENEKLKSAKSDCVLEVILTDFKVRTTYFLENNVILHDELDEMLSKDKEQMLHYFCQRFDHNKTILEELVPLLGSKITDITNEFHLENDGKINKSREAGQSIVDTCFALYDNEMNLRLMPSSNAILNNDMILAVDNIWRKQALMNFDTNYKIGSQRLVEEYRTALETLMNKKLEEVGLNNLRFKNEQTSLAEKLIQNITKLYDADIFVAQEISLNKAFLQNEHFVLVQKYTDIFKDQARMENLNVLPLFIQKLKASFNESLEKAFVRLTELQNKLKEAVKQKIEEIKLEYQNGMDQIKNCSQIYSQQDIEDFHRNSIENGVEKLQLPHFLSSQENHDFHDLLIYELNQQFEELNSIYQSKLEESNNHTKTVIADAIIEYRSIMTEDINNMAFKTEFDSLHEKTVSILEDKFCSQMSFLPIDMFSNYQSNLEEELQRASIPMLYEFTTKEMEIEEQIDSCYNDALQNYRFGMDNIIIKSQLEVILIACHEYYKQLNINEFSRNANALKSYAQSKIENLEKQISLTFKELLSRKDLNSNTKECSTNNLQATNKMLNSVATNIQGKALSGISKQSPIGKKWLQNNIDYQQEKCNHDLEENDTESSESTSFIISKNNLNKSKEFTVSNENTNIETRRNDICDDSHGRIHFTEKAEFRKKDLQSSPKEDRTQIPGPISLEGLPPPPPPPLPTLLSTQSNASVLLNKVNTSKNTSNKVKTDGLIMPDLCDEIKNFKFKRSVDKENETLEHNYSKSGDNENREINLVSKNSLSSKVLSNHLSGEKPSVSTPTESASTVLAQNDKNELNEPIQSITEVLDNRSTVFVEGTGYVPSPPPLPPPVSALFNKEVKSNATKVQPIGSDIITNLCHEIKSFKFKKSSRKEIVTTINSSPNLAEEVLCDNPAPDNEVGKESGKCQTEIILSKAGIFKINDDANTNSTAECKDEIPDVVSNSSGSLLSPEDKKTLDVHSELMKELLLLRGSHLKSSNRRKRNILPKEPDLITILKTAITEHKKAKNGDSESEDSAMEDAWEDSEQITE